MEKNDISVDDIIKVIRKAALSSIEKSEELSELQRLFHKDTRTYWKVVAKLRETIETDIQEIRKRYEREQILTENIFR